MFGSCSRKLALILVSDFKKYNFYLLPINCRFVSEKEAYP